ncbi:MAG: hypothetical protein WBM72_07650, partial [Actinomycetota bacterium]
MVTRRRRVDIVAQVGGLAVLGVCAIPAATGRVGSTEHVVFEGVNGLPDAIEPDAIIRSGVPTSGVSFVSGHVVL